MVGIEQVKGLLRFVVEFGTDREFWSGKKVRKYCTAPVRDVDSQAVDVSSDETYPPTLPSGYDYDDLDTVCGLVRGNCGWGSPQCFLPPAIRCVTLMIEYDYMIYCNMIVNDTLCTMVLSDVSSRRCENYHSNPILIFIFIIIVNSLLFLIILIILIFIPTNICLQ